MLLRRSANQRAIKAPVGTQLTAQAPRRTGEVVVEGEVARHHDGERAGVERGAEPALRVLHDRALAGGEPECRGRGEVGIGGGLRPGVVLARDGGVEERCDTQALEDEGHLCARGVGREPQPISGPEAASTITSRPCSRSALLSRSRWSGSLALA